MAYRPAVGKNSLIHTEKYGMCILTASPEYMNSESHLQASHQPDGNTCRQLAREMKIPYMIASLLGQRGVTDSNEAEAFLYPRLADLPSPFLLKDMDKAVDLILQICRQQGTILIHGDYDVDGISGSALLSLFFAGLGISTICFQPNRLTEGYGLQKKVIEQYTPDDGPALLITVDCGISSHEEVLFARESGYRVIITDHHQPPAVLPDAEAIVNPQQLGCIFPYNDLAGVGVAFFLAMAIRSRMVEQGMIARENAPNLKNLLGLVALGTVADVMPLTGINRILVKAGLEVISSRSIPWAWALCDRAGLKEGPVTSEDISFRLAPRINAPGRLGKPESAFRLLTSTETITAIELAEMLESINRDRRQLEQETIDEIYRQCALQDGMGYEGLVVYGDYHPGIIGVLASRIVEKFHKPAIILTDDAAGKDSLKGSGRSVEQINLYETLQKCDDYILQFGGHAMAAGLTMNKKDLPHFTKQFNATVAMADGVLDRKRDNALQYDFMIDREMVFDNRFVRYYELLEPFGNGNPEPVFLMPGLEMKRVRAINSHLKYSVNVNGTTFRGIGFNMADKIDLVQNKSVNLLFKLKKNVYRGEKYIELHAVDITEAP